LKGHLKKVKKGNLKALLNIPNNCIHRGGRLKKDSGTIVCPSYIIIEHDGCVASSGCDAVAVHWGKRRALLIEVKCGNISQHDARKAVRQLRACYAYYKDKLKSFEFIPIFLKERGKRLEIYARKELDGMKGLLRKNSGDDLSLIK